MKQLVFRLVLISFCLVAVSGCSHTLTVENMRDFCLASTIESPGKKIDVGIKPAIGNYDQIWCYNSIVEKFNSRREIGKFCSNFVDGRSIFKPDYILSLEPQVKYESSGWNYIVNFPGGIIFAPAWHGYTYYVKIATNVAIYSGDGSELKKFTIDTSYSIRHSEFDRTWYPAFQFCVLNALGGFYTAFVYDNDITSHVKNVIKDNYSSYVVGNIMEEIKAFEANKSVR